MNLTEAMEFIHSTSWQGSRLGLERISSLMNRLGNPQNELHFIHVAGTNGKGSVCMMLSSILTRAGYKTGLFTSPHLIRFNERMKINGIDITDDELITLIERIKPYVDEMKEKPTEFELITAMAFLYFKMKRCNIVVLEVGLGGRLDSTNIIPAPEVAVVTNIGLEHTEVLGDTLEKISREKAGIFKEGTTAVIYRGTPEVEKVYETVCNEKRIALIKSHFEDIIMHGQDLNGQCFDWQELRGLNLGLLGAHQIKNAVVALETVCVLKQKGWKISEADIKQGLANAKWSARFEVLNREPLFIVDGGHNPQCIEALTQNISDYLPDEKIVFLTGVLADKDYSKMMEQVMPYAKGFVCLTPDSDRALSAEKLASYLVEKGFDATGHDDVAKGIIAALEKAEGGAVVAYGSLYLVGAIYSLFKTAFRKWQRKESIKSRDKLNSEVRERFSGQIVHRILESNEFKKANTIMSYMAVKNEVDLSRLQLAAENLGKKIVYPYCISNTEMIALLPGSKDAWSVGHYGILEPDPKRSEIVDPESIDLVLCPCTAFDEKCNRMGMGAGYYDRYLIKCKNASTASVAFEVQKVKEVKVDSWDKSMQMAFTEYRVYKKLD